MNITQEPTWIFQISKPKALLVVAHSDDETIFAGGLILSTNNVEWTIICVKPADQRRKEEFLSACNFLEKNSKNRIEPVLFSPVYNIDGSIKTSWLQSELRPYRNRYDFVLTHNKDGEYGHETHKLVHRCTIETLENPNTWLFISPGSINVNQKALMSKHPKGNVTLNLTTRVQKLKIQTFQECHKSQAKLYGYDPISRKLRNTDLRKTLKWEFESKKEQYTFYV